MTDECQADPATAAAPRPPWLGPIVRAVVTTPDLAGSVAAYRDGLGLVVRRRERVPAGVARAWAAPAVAGARSALIGPASRIGGDLLLVEVPAGPRPAPLRSYGWAALELCVTDVEATLARLTGGFRVIGRPAALSAGEDGAAGEEAAAGPGAALCAAQVVGPAGEVLYLTEIRRPVPPFRLPRSSGGPEADGVFVAVLAASDLATTRRWWEERFPVRRCSDRHATIGVLNRAQSRPADATTRISSLQLSGRALVEIDQYPEGAGRHRPRRDSLPSGIALIAVGVPDPGTGSTNAGRTVTSGADGELLELVPAPRPIDVL